MLLKQNSCHLDGSSCLLFFIYFPGLLDKGRFKWGGCFAFLHALEPELFFHEPEPGSVIAVFVNDLVPHAGGANPQAALAVQLAVNHHGLQGLGMGGDTQDLVILALEMPVFSRSDFHSILPKSHAPGIVPARGECG